MEITINIKLEDEDISLLIKSLWEIIKKVNKEGNNISKEIFKENDLRQCEEFLNSTDASNIYHEYTGTSNNKESVIKIDENQKKNEEK